MERSERDTFDRGQAGSLGGLGDAVEILEAHYVAIGFDPENRELLDKEIERLRQILPEDVDSGLLDRVASCMVGINLQRGARKERK